MLPGPQEGALKEIRQQLADQVRSACSAATPLVIRAGDSKAFYGQPVTGEALHIDAYRGVLDHDPSELVLSAAAGTPLKEIEDTLAAQGQFLPFDPPAHDDRTTLGGIIATGLSGPRRPWTGPVRDYVLGIRCINGRGQILKFGGQVIKNVAGYDVSRLLTGSMGTLAVILEVSLKVLPRPAFELGLIAEMPLAKARDYIQHWSLRPMPVSGACYYAGRLRLRLSGYEQAVRKVAAESGLQQDDNLDFWNNLRHQRLAFFRSEGPLWRVSLPARHMTFDWPGERLIDWGGSLHWINTDTNAEELRNAVAAAGGHATLYHAGGIEAPRFHPLPAALMQLQRRLKAAFDPSGILNPGRMYPGL